MGLMLQVNVKAGHDDAMWKNVRSMFVNTGDVLRRVSELSDIFVITDGQEAAHEALKRLQANPGTIDVNVGLIETRRAVNKPIDTDRPVYMVFIDCERGREDAVISQVETLSGKDMEVVFTAIVYSFESDVVSLVISDWKNHEIAGKIRAIAGVTDTAIYELRD